MKSPGTRLDSKGRRPDCQREYLELTSYAGEIAAGYTRKLTNDVCVTISRAYRGVPYLENTIVLSPNRNGSTGTKVSEMCCNGADCKEEGLPCYVSDTRTS